MSINGRDSSGLVLCTITLPVNRAQQLHSSTEVENVQTLTELRNSILLYLTEQTNDVIIVTYGVGGGRIFLYALLQGMSPYFFLLARVCECKTSVKSPSSMEFPA